MAQQKAKNSPDWWYNLTLVPGFSLMHNAFFWRPLDCLHTMNGRFHFHASSSSGFSRGRLAAFLGIGLMAVFSGPMAAQSNGTLQYQGRVLVGPNLFNGTGQFKFSLVNAGASQTFWNSSTPPGGQTEPASAVTVGVTNGVYSVLLGDTGLPNMAVLPANLFTNTAAQGTAAPLFLRVWFNDGTNGSQLLAPDQRVSPVGLALAATYAQNAQSALVANSVPDGSLTAAKFAPGTLAATNLAGVLSTNQLPPQVALKSDLVGLSGGGGGGGAIPRGATLVSDSPNDASLVSQGYQRFYSVLAPAWVASTSPAPSPRVGQSAVWTGQRWFVFGGETLSGSQYGDGSSYDPVSDTWFAFPGSPDLVARRDAAMVWTGSRALIWGGVNKDGPIKTGASVDPMMQNNPVIPMPVQGAPSARYGHGAAWTARYMAIWGGSDGKGGLLGDLSLWDSSNNQWVPSSQVENLIGVHPVAAMGASVIWTGQALLVWGGSAGSGRLATGGLWTPGAGGSPGVWRNLASTGALPPAYDHVGVWTGSAAIFWGGLSMGSHAVVNSGALYDPLSDTWRSVSTLNAPSPRRNAAAAWTGGEMIVYGGSSPSGAPVNSAHAYNPATDTWRTLSTGGAPASRYLASAAWTGTEFLAFGGVTIRNSSPEAVALLQRLNPQSDWYFYRHP